MNIILIRFFLPIFKSSLLKKSIGFTSLSFLILSTGILAADFESNYNSGSQNYDIYVVPGTYSFKVTNVPNNYWVEYYVNDVFIQTQQSGLLSSPTFSYYFSSNSNCKINIYDNNWNYLFTHWWNVYIGKPDLVISSSSLSKTSLLAGESLTANATVKNQGQVDAGSSTLNYYLSTNSTYGSDTYLDNDAVSALSVGASGSESQSLTIPSSTNPGTYYIIFRADATSIISESSETNNYNSKAFTVNPPPKPDLRVTSLSVSNTNIIPGEKLNMSCTFINEGTLKTNLTTIYYLKYYLSADNNYDAGVDKEIASEAYGGIASLGIGESKTDTKSPTISSSDLPVSSGTCYVLAVIDVTLKIPELDENDNEKYVAKTIYIKRPDVSVSTITTNPSPPVAGSSVNISTSLINIGDAEAQNITLRYYVDNVYQDIDTDGSIAVGGSQDEDFNYTFTTDGSHTIKVVVDQVTAVETESSTSNNTQTITVNVAPEPNPDLRVTSFSVSNANVIPGEKLNMSCTFVNEGTLKTNLTTIYYLKYYLSADNNYDAGVDKEIASEAYGGVASLGIGESKTDTKSPTISSSDLPVSSGTCYVLAVIDVTQKIPELDENDNEKYVAKTIYIKRPDVSVSTITTNPSPPVAGSSVNISTNLINIGDAEAQNITLRYYVDNVYQDIDTDGSIAVGGSQDEDFNYTFTTDGSHTIKVVVDQVTAVETESSTSNNTQTITVNVAPEPKPDLRVTSLTMTNTQIIPGVVMNLTSVIKNEGTDNVGILTTFQLGYFLSKDMIWDPADEYIGYELITGLSQEESKTKNATITINSEQLPVTTGTCYLLSVVDYKENIDELDEGDNVTYLAKPVYIKRPDVSVSTITTNPSPPVAGSSVNISTSLINIGDAEAQNITLRYYVDNVYQDIDTDGSIAVGGSQDEDFNYTFTTDGSHTIKVVVDQVTAVETESSTSNNTKTITVNVAPEPKPDLRVTSLTMTETQIIPGEVMHLTSVIKNEGTDNVGLLTTFQLGYFLSKDITWDPADEYIGYELITGLSQGESKTKNATITINSEQLPVTTGTCYLLSVVDYKENIDELDEGDNVTYLAKTVYIKRPDLEVISIWTNPAVPVAGDNVDVYTELKNRGNAEAKDVAITYYINNVKIDTDVDGSMDPGSIQQESMSYTFPSEGTYSIKVVVDPVTSVETESDNSNNTMTVDLVVNPEPMPDLKISYINKPESVVAGVKFDIQAEVQNVGNKNAGITKVEYYLSVDNVFDENDVFLESNWVQTAFAGLDSGNSDMNENTLKLDEGLADGTYYILFILDGGNKVIESDETNNNRNFPITVIPSPKADLEFLNVSVLPTMIYPGSKFETTCVIKNTGLVNAKISTLAYYLSADNVLDQQDEKLGDKQIKLLTGLDAGEQYTESATLKLPLITSFGNYYILFIADAGEDVVEEDENNNLASIAIEGVPSLVTHVKDIDPNLDNNDAILDFKVFGKEIKIDFSEELTETSINKNSVILQEIGGGAVEYTLRYDDKDLLQAPNIRINFVKPLVGGQMYEVIIKPAVLDKFGNPVEEFTFNVQTEVTDQQMLELEKTTINTVASAVYDLNLTNNYYDLWTFLGDKHVDMNMRIEEDKNHIIDNGFENPRVDLSDISRRFEVDGKYYYVAQMKYKNNIVNEATVRIVVGEDYIPVDDLETCFKVFLTYFGSYDLSTEELEQYQRAVKKIGFLQILNNVILDIRNAALDVVVSLPHDQVDAIASSLISNFTTELPETLLEMFLYQKNQQLKVSFDDAIDFVGNHSGPISKYGDASYIYWVDAMLTWETMAYAEMVDALWEERGDLSNQLEAVLSKVQSELMTILVNESIGELHNVFKTLQNILKVKSIIDGVFGTHGYCMDYADEISRLRESRKTMLSNGPGWEATFAVALVQLYQQTDPGIIRPEIPVVIAPANGKILETSTPVFEWNRYKDGGDGESMTGYQLRVRCDDDNDEIVYETGFVASSDATGHLYSPGSYSGLDYETGSELVSNALVFGKIYHWHLRFRDSGGDWSEWSGDDPAPHTVFHMPYPPTASIRGGGQICDDGSSTTELIVNLEGRAPFAFEYTDGNETIIVNDYNLTQYSISVDKPGEYALQSVSDANTQGYVEGMAVVEAVPCTTSLAKISGGGKACNDGTGVTITVEFTGIAPFSFTYIVGEQEFYVSDIMENTHEFLAFNSGEYYLVEASDASGVSAIINGVAEVELGDLPVAELTGGGTICTGGEGTLLQVYLSGNAPWIIGYTDGEMDYVSDEIYSSPYSLEVNKEGGYNLTFVSDGNCEGEVSGYAEVTEVSNCDCDDRATISGGGTICQGSESASLRFDFEGIEPFTLIYTDGLNEYTITNIYENPFYVPVENEGVYELVSVTGGNNCQGIVNGIARIKSFEKPAAEISGGGTICGDGTETALMVSLSGNAPWSFIYSDDENSYEVENLWQDNYFINTSIGGTYKLLAVYDENCAGTVNGTAIVNKIDDCSCLASATISGGGRICDDGGTAEISVAFKGTAPWSFSYTDGVSEYSVVDVLTSPYIITVNRPGTFKLTMMSDLNCLGSTDGVAKVQVQTAPDVTCGDDISVCLGTEVSLFGKGATKYTWDNNVKQGVAFIPAATAIYTVIGEDANGCTGTSGILITVLPKPVISGGEDKSVCTGDEVTLTATGGVKYTWDNNVQQGVSFIPSASANYIATVENQDGCVATDEVHIEVRENPVISCGPDQVVCSDGEVTLTATGGITYVWDNGVNQGIPFVPVSTKTYKVVAVDQFGCKGNSEINVEVLTSPKIELEDGIALMQGETRLLDAGANFKKYYWNGSAISSSSSFLVKTSNLEPGSYVYFVKVVDNNGCEGTDSTSIEVKYLTGIIDDYSQFRMSLYPNPSDGIFDLEIEGLSGDRIWIEILDLNGKRVIYKEVPLMESSYHEQFDFRMNMKGMYIIKINDGQTQMVGRITIR